ncbi:hypothetical protein K8T06_06065, partial [bacterium]|nr:hypothetical protein [bacterium]
MKNIYKQFTYFLLLIFFSGCVFQKKPDAVADLHTILFPENLPDCQPAQQDSASITPTAISNQIPESSPELTEHGYSELTEIEIATESQATPIPVYLDIPDESHIR